MTFKSEMVFRCMLCDAVCTSVGGVADHAANCDKPTDGRCPHVNLSYDEGSPDSYPKALQMFPRIGCEDCGEWLEPRRLRHS